MGFWIIDHDSPNKRHNHDKNDPTIRDEEWLAGSIRHNLMTAATISMIEGMFASLEFMKVYGKGMIKVKKGTKNGVALTIPTNTKYLSGFTFKQRDEVEDEATTYTVQFFLTDYLDGAIVRMLMLRWSGAAQL